MNTVEPTPSQIWFTRTISIPDVSNLLALLPDSGGLSWVTGLPGAQTGIVAWGEIERAEFIGPERFSRATRWWGNWCSAAQGDEQIAFTSFAFKAKESNSVVIVPQFAVRRLAGHCYLTVTGQSAQIEQLLEQGLALLAQDTQGPTGITNITWLEGSQTLEDWQDSVGAAVKRINNGELDKVVLARDIVAQSDEPLHLGSLLMRLNLSFPQCWTFLVDGLIGATPELLVRRENKTVTSRVLAGTIRRSSNTNRDDELAAELIESKKNQQEHSYAVESVAVVLARYCTDLEVPEQPFVLQLANVQHLATDVIGQIVEPVPVLTLAASLHPSAAVCGTPTERASAIIDELEGLARGRYSGPVGWIDGSGNGELGIALRCGLVEGVERKTLRLFAGCGIVAGSTPASELAESNSKFTAMRDVLS